MDTGEFAGGSSVGPLRCEESRPARGILRASPPPWRIRSVAWAANRRPTSTQAESMSQRGAFFQPVQPKALPGRGSGLLPAGRHSGRTQV